MFSSTSSVSDKVANWQNSIKKSKSPEFKIPNQIPLPNKRIPRRKPSVTDNKKHEKKKRNVQPMISNNARLSAPYNFVNNVSM